MHVTLRAFVFIDSLQPQLASYLATSSQGFALMWELLFIASSYRLPIVMTTVNRALSGPFNIHCDHSDTMGGRDTGWIQLYGENHQQAYDNCIMAIRIAEHMDVRLPVTHMYDGYVISGAIGPLITLDDDKVRDFISGTEVYFVSQRVAANQADQDLADLENAADLVGGIPAPSEDELVNILYDVKRSSALQQSQLLAETLVDHVAEDRRLESRGIKQAGFVVLKSVEFPSVLVETAFINNPVEARLLKSPDFQRRIARQHAEGVRRYFERNRVGLGASSTGETR